MVTRFDWSGAMFESPINLILIVCSILTLGIALERAYYFWKRRGQPDRTLQGVLGRIREGKPGEATWMLNACPHPLGPVAARLLGSDVASESGEQDMLVALSEQKLALERNVGFLGTMAATAPFIGLLGTVWGIMTAFQDMAAAGSASPAVVAPGVAEALTTTAGGLVVAICALLSYNYFTRRASVMLTIAENHARIIRLNAIEAGIAGSMRADKGPARQATGALRSE